MKFLLDMSLPFPGMDPYLEHPALWPDVHNRLITAIADEVTPLVAPRYYIGLERRTYLLKPDDEVNETFLEVREVGTGRLVTILELLSPANKLSEEGRNQYQQKRTHIFLSQTNLVEVDLLRAGKPMPVIGQEVDSDYRILVSRAWQRPRAQLYPFNLRQPIPVFPLPLVRGDKAPPVDLGAILQALYERARFDLRLDYTQPPFPPLSDEDSAWARQLVANVG